MKSSTGHSIISHISFEERKVEIYNNLVLLITALSYIFSRTVRIKAIVINTFVYQILPNISLFYLQNKSLRIIDVPGHERLRQTMMNQYKSLAR